MKTCDNSDKQPRQHNFTSNWCVREEEPALMCFYNCREEEEVEDLPQNVTSSPSSFYHVIYVALMAGITCPPGSIKPLSHMRCNSSRPSSCECRETRRNPTWGWRRRIIYTKTPMKRHNASEERGAAEPRSLAVTPDWHPASTLTLSNIKITQWNFLLINLALIKS